MIEFVLIKAVYGIVSSRPEKYRHMSGVTYGGILFFLSDHHVVFSLDKR